MNHILWDGLTNKRIAAIYKWDFYRLATCFFLFLLLLSFVCVCKYTGKAWIISNSQTYLNCENYKISIVAKTKKYDYKINYGWLEKLLDKYKYRWYITSYICAYYIYIYQILIYNYSEILKYILFPTLNYL